jgi:hypothetical protein
MAHSYTPLVKKLGIGEGFNVFLVNAPPDYRALISPLPAAISFTAAANSSTDFVHAFSTKRAELARLLVGLRKKLPADAPVWVSWPKKSSKVPTGLPRTPSARSVSGSIPELPPDSFTPGATLTRPSLTVTTVVLGPSANGIQIRSRDDHGARK